MIIKKCINFSKKLHKTTCMNNSAMYNKVKSKKKIKMLICYNNEVTINYLRWLMMTSTGFFFSTHQKSDDKYHLYYEYDLFVSM